MEETADQDNKHQEVGEEHLAILIKQAGEEARARRRKAMEQHSKRLQSAIAEGVSRWKKSIPK